jgi:tetratricopeptide (TPR) repeat protein
VFTLALVVLLQATPAVQVRPDECAAQDADNPWERAKRPQLRKYCDRLAAAATRLRGPTSQAAEALSLADEAHALWTEGKGAALLRGRALARMGRDREAKQVLMQALDDNGMGEPNAALSLARVSARTGDLEASREWYRRVLLQGSVLSGQDRVASSLEAGLAFMSAGETGLPDAVQAFRQAHRAAAGTQVVPTLLLALALDRSGDAAVARSLLQELGRVDDKAISTDARTEPFASVGLPTEALAARAMLQELRDPAAALRDWQRYAESAKGPWTEHARARAVAKKPKTAPGRGP